MTRKTWTHAKMKITTTNIETMAKARPLGQRRLFSDKIHNTRTRKTWTHAKMKATTTNIEATVNVKPPRWWILLSDEEHNARTRKTRTHAKMKTTTRTLRQRRTQGHQDEEDYLSTKSTTVGRRRPKYTQRWRPQQRRLRWRWMQSWGRRGRHNEEPATANTTMRMTKRYHNDEDHTTPHTTTIKTKNTKITTVKTMDGERLRPWVWGGIGAIGRLHSSVSGEVKLKTHCLVVGVVACELQL